MNKYHLICRSYLTTLSYAVRIIYQHILLSQLISEREPKIDIILFLPVMLTWLHLLLACWIGLKELSPSTVNLKRLYEKETLPTEPILVIISPGADPSQELEELATSVIGLDKYHQVSVSVSVTLWHPIHFVLASVEVHKMERQGI